MRLATCASTVKLNVKHMFHSICAHLWIIPCDHIWKFTCLSACKLICSQQTHRDYTWISCLTTCQKHATNAWPHVYIHVASCAKPRMDHMLLHETGTCLTALSTRSPGAFTLERTQGSNAITLYPNLKKPTCPHHANIHMLSHMSYNMWLSDNIVTWT